MTVGFALCGSFCTYASVFPVMAELAKKHRVIPIFSHSAYTLDSRFGTAQSHIDRATAICGQSPLHTIPEVEPIGPKKLLDALVIAPCTGNTLAKLAHSIADTPVTMAAKSHLRNGRSESSCAAAASILSPSGRMTPSRNPPAWWQIFPSFPRLWKP